MPHPKANQKVSLVITDLDNTLFDWVHIWYESFNAMLDRIVTDSGLSSSDLEKEFRQVFQKHGTSEYAFAIEELPSLQRKYSGQKLTEVFSEAIHAYNTARRRNLQLYRSVLSTLEALKDKGCLIVGYTESMAYYANSRVKKLDLDRILDYVYSPEDHDLPVGITKDQLRRYPPEHYRLRRTITRHTPRGERKPNPAVLMDIIRSVGGTAEETIYVGDNLMKDVAMAQAVPVTDVWAKYGTAQERPEYELLRRVTHWSDGDVEKEKNTTEAQVSPNYVLTDSFSELLDLFHFVPFLDKSEAHIQVLVDVWKKIIDVQQHFNDLELRIRNYAITLIVAIMGAAAFAFKEHLDFFVFGVNVPLASGLLLCALLGWQAFYFMDRFWYHRLLYGAVKQGTQIERRLKPVLPQIGLTESISDASPLTLWRWKIRSTVKVDLFYQGIAVGLLAMAILSFAAHGGSNIPETRDARTSQAAAPAPVSEDSKTQGRSASATPPRENEQNTHRPQSSGIPSRRTFPLKSPETDNAKSGEKQE